MISVLNHKKITIVLFILAASASMAFAHAHTHIGINQDQTWDGGDDNKLWFFSMPGTPGWPNWSEPLELVYQDAGPLAGKYVCEELACWHSGHPDHGNWQLGGTDPGVTPDWRIALQRVSFDAGFSMVEESNPFQAVLTTDGETYEFPQLYMTDKYNENGTLGVWGFHYHLLFVAEADGIGETFTATFKALDFGTTGFSPSDNYTMTFVTTPEPATMSLLGIGARALLRKRRGA